MHQYGSICLVLCAAERLPLGGKVCCCYIIYQVGESNMTHDPGKRCPVSTCTRLHVCSWLGARCACYVAATPMLLQGPSMSPFAIWAASQSKLELELSEQGNISNDTKSEVKEVCPSEQVIACCVACP